MLAVGGLGLGLLGSGLHAAITDGGTVTATVNTGTLACALSSLDPVAVVSNGGHTVTANLPTISSSASGNAYLSDLTVTNGGTTPEVVHWSEATSGTIVWQPAGRMGYAAGSAADPMSTDLTLAPGASHTYTQDTGFMWAALLPADEGATASVAYTATCGDVPTTPPVTSNISFVGAANMATVAPPASTAGTCPNGMYDWVSANANQWCGNGTFPVASTSTFPSTGQLSVTASGGAAVVAYTGKTATTFTGLTNVSGTGYVTPGAAVKGAATLLALPAGSLPGDYALVMTYGQTGGNNAQVPSGYTSLQSSGASNMQTILSYRVLVAGDTTIPATTTGYGEEVAVYRGVAGFGAHTSIGGNLNNVGGASYPMLCSALSLTKTDGSSWVACMGGDGFATTNANTMVFDSNTTNRSASLPDIHTGLADTSKGVTSWAQAGWTGDNFVLPGSHGVVVHSIELLSK